MADRTHQILELLITENKMEVAELASHIGVSQVTIRKDLDELERQGIVRREHGFAVLRSQDDIRGRIAYHYEAKLLIARRAAGLVHDGETIMIESGSCCALLAATLAETKKELTVITNSVFIADYIRGRSKLQIILSGGIYQQDAQVLVGPMVRQAVDNFWVDKFFIGTDGYHARTGFTNQDQMRAQAVRDMAHQAERVYVLTESEKFSRRGVVPLNLKNPVTVITDNRLDAQTAAQLQAEHIEVLTA